MSGSATNPEGHLFVVHGRMERVVHDAAIIPVDREVDFNSTWHELLGKTSVPPPVTWDDGWGRIRDDQWLVQVGDGDYSRVLDRVARAVDDIQAAGVAARGGRQLPLVVLPVLGAGRGGHSHEPGRVLKDLVAHLTRLGRERPLDIALVTPEQSVYAAAQFARRELLTPLGDDLEHTAQDLGEHAKRGDLALFLGAGVSVPAGLMSWESLLEQLAGDISTAELSSPSLSAVDRAELIEMANPHGFQHRVARLVSEAQRPALLHALLAGLDAKQVVTTNYDVLYESAVGATNRKVASVMPWGSALGSDRWVLKLHGDVEHESTIVLTRRHMVRYDAANRPSAAMLQSVLLTKYMLVVGASLADDNVVRLAHEVQAYREEYQPKKTHTPFGTVLDVAEPGDRARARLWEGQLDWLHLSGSSTLPPTRAVELLIDRVGFHATQDSSWLLDERFAGLLGTERDRDLAATARALLRELGGSSTETWAPLAERLEQPGAQRA